MFKVYLLCSFFCQSNYILCIIILEKLNEIIYKKLVQGLMFPTKGYLQNAVCPYYQHGLCHRPYCHFKHKKKGKFTIFIVVVVVVISVANVVGFCIR